MKQPIVSIIGDHQKSRCGNIEKPWMNHCDAEWIPAFAGMTGMGGNDVSGQEWRVGGNDESAREWRGACLAASREALKWGKP